MTHRLPLRPSLRPLSAGPTLSPSAGQVGRLIALLSNLREGTLDRRAFKRMALNFRFELTSLESSASSVVGNSTSNSASTEAISTGNASSKQSRFSVMGKDLSPEGVGLIHSRPLPFRLVRLSLIDAPEPVYLDVDLTWCRFIKSGHYESGGRLLIDSQAAA